MKIALVAVSLCLAARALAQGGLPWQPIEQVQTRVVAQVIAPLWCGSPPGDRTRLFIQTHGGPLSVCTIANSPDGEQTYTLQATPFLSGLGGTRSVAFAPDYATSGHLYIAAQTSWPGGVGTQITRYRRSTANADIGDPASATPILRLLNAGGDHSVGSIHFGPDGMLYIGVGDQFNGPNAQDLTLLNGKMLRIDPSRDGFPGDAGRNYAIPVGNPYPIGGEPNSPRPEIFSVGLRNPWRWSFDRATGVAWIADVGEGSIEEVSVMTPTAGATINFGWPRFEGLRASSGTPLVPSTLLRKPVISYPHVLSSREDELRGVTGFSVTGGVVYRGNALPSLRGRYLMADYARSWLLAFSAAMPSSHPTDLGPQAARLVTGSTQPLAGVVHIGEDADGELYVCEMGGGRVRKIVPYVPPPVAPLHAPAPGGLEESETRKGGVFAD